VLHLGDVFFNGMYPFIDAGTGGSSNGMIAGVEPALKLSNATTKIVPATVRSPIERRSRAIVTSWRPGQPRTLTTRGGRAS
jgi:hypothetical protein